MRDTDTRVQSEIQSGPFSDGTDSKYVLEIRGVVSDAGNYTDKIGPDGRFVFEKTGVVRYVSIDEQGPLGGYRSIGTFYTRERVDQLINALTLARNAAFGKEER